MITFISPFLEARDVQPTVDLYCRCLGFERVDSPEEHSHGVFAVRSGKAHIAFVQAREGQALKGRSREGQEDEGNALLGNGVRFYLDTDDVDALYARARDGGIEILEDLADKPYRMREFTVRDPNGYRLTFGQFIQTPASQLLLGHVSEAA